jgi:hypothetical protein
LKGIDSDYLRDRPQVAGYEPVMTNPTTPLPPLDPEARLANRTALLTVLALVAFLVAVIAMPLTFRETEATGPRVLAGTPLAIGFGAALAARGARTQLRAHRGQSELAPAAAAEPDA